MASLRIDGCPVAAANAYSFAEFASPPSNGEGFLNGCKCACGGARSVALEAGCTMIFGEISYLHDSGRAGRRSLSANGSNSRCNSESSRWRRADRQSWMHHRRHVKTRRAFFQMQSHAQATTPPPLRTCQSVKTARAAMQCNHRQT